MINISKFFYPMNDCNLIRLGNKNDGDYVVEKNSVRNSEILLSFGLGDDWSFESDFSKLGKKKIYTYDYSVNLRFWIVNFIKSLINILLFSCIIPFFGLVLMRLLGMVQSIALHTQDERKIPYVMAGIFYMAMVAQNSSNTSLPLEIKIFALGATIALFVAFFINLFTKISIHTVGMGGFLAMIIIVIGKGYQGGEFLFIFGILSCGLVGTARLILGAHNSSDIYGGYVVGFFAQFIALQYLFA